MITQERLKELLDYNPETGVFVWRVNKRGLGAKIGKQAGCVAVRGAVVIRVDRVNYYAHRLAWLYVYGEFPSMDIDHRDLDKTNNKINNLRLATDSQNLANVRSRRHGLKGAYWHKTAKRWVAQIKKHHRNIYLGLFPTEEDAHNAYVFAANKIHGEFARAA